MTPDNDEQDLVKALDNVAGLTASIGSTPPPSPVAVSPTVATPAPVVNVITSHFAPAPTPTPTPPVVSPAPYLSHDEAVAADFPVPNDAKEADNTDVSASSASSDTEDTGPLSSIKKDALLELRPLVDKLNVSPEEKFDTYLLLIRSTDDASLIEPAHAAARSIGDEARRAEALLDIIKEIDYLSHSKKDTM